MIQSKDMLDLFPKIPLFYNISIKTCLPKHRSEQNGRGKVAYIKSGLIYSKTSGDTINFAKNIQCTSKYSQKCIRQRYDWLTRIMSLFESLVRASANCCLSFGLQLVAQLRTTAGAVCSRAQSSPTDRRRDDIFVQSLLREFSVSMTQISDLSSEIIKSFRKHHLFTLAFHCEIGRSGISSSNLLI